MAHFLRQYEIVMLTRYEILKELKRMGVKEPCLLKAYLRDFENYIGTHYGLEIVKRKKKLDHSPQDKSYPLYEL